MNKDLIIQKQDEFIAELKKQLNVKWFASGSMLRKLESDLSALRDDKEEPKDQYGYPFSTLDNNTGLSSSLPPQPRRGAEEILTDFLDCEGFDIPDKAIEKIIEAMKEYASQFQSSSLPPQPGRGAEEILENKFNDGTIRRITYIPDIRGIIEAMNEYRTQSEGKDMYPKWISVKELTPPDYERVLWIDNRDGFINLGYFVWSQTPVNYMTHWMKLPQKPEKK